MLTYFIEESLRQPVAQSLHRKGRGFGKDSEDMEVEKFESIEADTHGVHQKCFYADRFSPSISCGGMDCVYYGNS